MFFIFIYPIDSKVLGVLLIEMIKVLLKYLKVRISGQYLQMFNSSQNFIFSRSYFICLFFKIFVRKFSLIRLF